MNKCRGELQKNIHYGFMGRTVYLPICGWHKFVVNVKVNVGKYAIHVHCETVFCQDPRYSSLHLPESSRPNKVAGFLKMIQARIPSMSSYRVRHTILLAILLMVQKSCAS